MSGFFRKFDPHQPFRWSPLAGEARRGLALLLILAILILPSRTIQAQMGGEELPPGVTGDDVYRVSRQMYCDVCAGVPISDCPSPTCMAWRQEVAVMLGQGYEDQEILERFAELYGSKISGVPIQNRDRTMALGLPALLIALFGGVVIWQVYRLRQRGESRAHQAARTAGQHQSYTRPVPDNVEQEALERFLKLVGEKS